MGICIGRGDKASLGEGAVHEERILGFENVES